jgi:ABC-type lipoprotein export system ATPase subunit
VFSGLQQQQETRGTLVFLTHNTNVKDICRDLVLTEDISIWMQVFAVRVAYGISLFRSGEESSFKS